MLMINKINGKTYELTNNPDAEGICQVYDSETNSVMLMKYSELEYWKAAELKNRQSALKAIYEHATKL